MSIRPSAYIILASTGRIFVKLGVGTFVNTEKNLSLVEIGQKY
jgi:hypothetical protein